MLKVNLYNKPKERVNAIEEIKSERINGEMSDFEHSFLCGLIKDNIPNKLVEVGIAAGYTSTIIMDCLMEVNPNAEMYSVDLNELYYKDKSLTNGYVIDVAKKHFKHPIKHIKMLGRYLPEQLDTIGNEIDFVLLDTVHSLPGELLDFLAVFPYLKNNAIVVLHDINLNHLNYTDTYATKVLFDCVVADKFLMNDEFGVANFPNIAAFRVNNDTSKYIENIFLALTTKWNYMPKKRELDIYYNHYLNNYSKDLVNLFRQAIILHQNTMEMMQKKQNREECIGDFYNFIKNKKNNLLIYGCGNFGKFFGEYLISKDVEFTGFIVSDTKKTGIWENQFQKPIYDIKDLPLEKKDCSILLAMAHCDKIIFDNLKTEEIDDFFPRCINGTSILFEYFKNEKILNN